MHLSCIKETRSYLNPMAAANVRGVRWLEARPSNLPRNALPMKKPILRGLSRHSHYALLLLALPSLAHSQERSLKEVEIRGTRATERIELDQPSAVGSRIGLTPRETPASVEILDQETIQRLGARTLTEAMALAAGVTTGVPGGAPGVVSMRGFTGNAITYLFDGTRIQGASMTARPMDSWNFERVEILRGPASVLYGEGALVGAMNFVPRRPNREVATAEALVSYGSFDTLRTAAGIGGALGKSSAFRIDFSRNATGGFIDRTRGEMLNLTSGVSTDFGSGVRLDLSFDYAKDDFQGYWGTPIIPASVARNPTGLVNDARGWVFDRALERTNYNVTDNVFRSDSVIGRAKLTWRASEAITLRNEFYYYKSDRRWKNAEVYTFNTGANLMDRSLVQIDHDHTLVGNRLDLTHRGELFGLRNRFVGGAEFSFTHFTNPRRFSNGNPVAMRTSVFDPAPGFYPGDPALFSGAGNQTDFTTKIPVYSVFAENAINLSPAWIALAGVRHESITVDRTVVDLAPGVARQEFSRTYSPTSWRLGTVYSITPTTQLYGQYSNAVAPVATVLLISQANSLFPLTRGTAFEVGMKQSVLGDRAEWTLALYGIEQTNVTTRDPANPNVTTNVGKQSSRGVELAAAVRATRQLTFSGSLALVDARFDTLIEAGNANRAGNTPPNVPDRVANARMTYRFSGMPVEIGAGVRHIGAFYTNNSNTTRVNDATLFDAFAGWRVGNGTLGVRVRNIGDRLWATWTGASQNQVILGEPRSFELSFQAAF